MSCVDGHCVVTVNGLRAREKKTRILCVRCVRTNYFAGEMDLVVRIEICVSSCFVREPLGVGDYWSPTSSRSIVTTYSE